MARTRKSAAGNSTATRLRQLLIVAGVVAALVFAVQGGEYGTRDLLHLRARQLAMTHAIDSLQRAVDSLKVYKHRIETDAALQERIAREEFGMVRGNKEFLYKIAEPDSAPRTP